MRQLRRGRSPRHRDGIPRGAGRRVFLIAGWEGVSGLLPGTPKRECVMTLEDLILAGLVAVPVMLLFVFLLPPLLYFGRSASSWASETISDYHFGWVFRSAETDREKGRRRGNRQFDAWLSSHIGGADGSGIDE